MGQHFNYEQQGYFNGKIPVSESATNRLFFFYLNSQLMWGTKRVGMLNHIKSATYLKQLELLIITIVIAQL